MMKALLLGRIYFAATLLFCLTVFASADDAESSAERPRERRERRSYAVESFMDNLRKNDAEKYERLLILREQDRAEFRSELRRILSARRAQMIAAGEMPPHPTPLAPRTERAGSEPNLRRRFHEPNPEIDELAGELRSLAKKYRQESNAKRKSELEQQMKVRLDSIFEIRESERAKMIEHMETKLDQLKRIMKQRHEKKDDILDRQLKEIIADCPSLS